jgi:hypothetical protein
MRRILFWIIAFSLLLLPGAASSDVISAESLPAADAAEKDGPSERLVTAETVNIETITGDLADLSAPGGLRLKLRDGKTREIPFSELLRLSLEGDEPSHPFASSAPRLILSGGQVVFGWIESSDDRFVIIIDESPLETAHKFEGICRRVVVPLVNIRYILFDAGVEDIGDAEQEALQSDLIVLRNGDRIRGIVKTLGRGGAVVRLETGDGRELKIPWSDLSGIRLAGSEVSYDAKAVINLTDGSNLRAVSFEAAPTSGESKEKRAYELRGRLAGNGTFSVPMEQLASIEFYQPGIIWIADVQPDRIETAGVFSAHYQPRMGSNVLGGPLTTAGNIYRSGIGVHARTILEYDLARFRTPEWRSKTFRCRYGMDDNSGPLADVDIAIKLDGKIVHEQKGIVRGTLYPTLELNVSEASRLTLEVDFGKNLDVQDRFNWLGPCIIREREREN